LWQTVNHVLSEEEGQVQRGQPDRECDQQNIQICRDTIEAPQPFFAGAVGQKWFSQHCQHLPWRETGLVSLGV